MPSQPPKAPAGDPPPAGPLQGPLNPGQQPVPCEQPVSDEGY